MRGPLALLLVLLASPVWAADVYVSNSGSDANSCETAESATPANAKLTISNALANCITAGEALIIHGGTYTGSANRIDSQSYTVPEGTSYDNAVTVRAKAGETVIIRPPYNQPGIRLNGAYSYLIFQDLTIDMVNSTSGSDADAVFLNATDHIRLQRMDLKNGYNFGMTVAFSTSFTEILDSLIHNFGYQGSESTNGHGIYITGCDALIDGNYIYDNHGYGIHMYNNSGSQSCPSRNVISRNRIQFNCRHGSPCYGAVMNWGTANVARNNVFSDMTGGVQDYTRATSNVIEFNTFFNIGSDGTIVHQFYSVGATVRYNLLYGNTNTSPQNLGTSESPGTAPTSTGNVSGDPGYTDSGNRDFTLTSSSIALNVVTCPAAVILDLTGATRPTGAGLCDAGAYERFTTGSSPIITTTVLANGQVGSVYYQTACATGGVEPYKWSLSSGSLPAGTSLSSTTSTCVVISGTLTTANTYSPVLGVADNASNTDTQSYTIVISAVTASCSGGEGPWALIADTCVGAGSSNGTAAAVTSAVSRTGGDISFCAVGNDQSQAAITPTDTGANTWSEVGSKVGKYGRVALYYAPLVTVSGSDTYTADPSGATSFPGLMCMTWRGAKASPLDGTTAGGLVIGGTSVSPGSVPLTQRWQLTVMALQAEDANIAELAGFTVYQRAYSLDKSFGIAIAWKVHMNTDTVSTPFTWGSPMAASAVSGTFLSTESYRPRPRMRRGM